VSHKIGRLTGDASARPALASCDAQETEPRRTCLGIDVFNAPSPVPQRENDRRQVGRAEDPKLARRRRRAFDTSKYFLQPYAIVSAAVRAAWDVSLSIFCGRGKLPLVLKAWATESPAARMSKIQFRRSAVRSRRPD